MASENVYPPLHTAEHLLTRLLCERFPTLSDLQIRLKSRKAVFTFNYNGTITPADREALERALQKIAREDLPVTEGSLPRAEALARLPNMHQVPEDADPVRVIHVGEGAGVVDARACIGRHVTSTAAIVNPRLPTLREEEPAIWRLTLVVS
jgi:misacylated tRNA(Ala) deacylase